MAAVVLSIAGSDPSGGAGIQADLKTFLACGVYGAAVVTSLTAQNTVGVRDRRDVAPEFVAAQLAAVLDDLPVAAIKTGMLPSAAVITIVAHALRARPVGALVVDPVLVATSGDSLADASALDTLRETLLPLATVITPNLQEAESLTGRRVRTRGEMREAARALVAMGARAALVKGGHLPDRACDVLAIGGTLHEMDAARIGTGQAHGTGCTLSAALAAGLATGMPLLDAAVRAKRYVRRALEAATPLGHGHRPLDHRVAADDT